MLRASVSCSLPMSSNANVARLYGRERLAQDVDDLVDVLPFGDQRRRNDRAIPRRLQMQPVVKELFLEDVSARAGRPGRVQVDAGEHPVAAQIRDGRQVAKRPQAVE